MWGGKPWTVLAVVATLAFAPSAARAQTTPPPPGANLPCTPSPSRPHPVLLVHGTGGNMYDSWQSMSTALKSAGYCVYAFNYGSHNGSGYAGVFGIGDIRESARQLAAEVDSVLARTGAGKVALVGHSQGGMMPRHYMRFLGGAAKVSELIGLAPSNHGTTTPLAAPSGWTCPACAQQAAGSAFLTELNAGDETPGTADYTNIVTRYDAVVTPYTSGYLRADGNAVTNLTLQDVCPTDTREHVGMPYDPPTISITLHALGRSGPADPAHRPPCTL